MTKNIKDYLHLYIGCNIAIAEERFNSPGLRLIGISDLGCQVRDESIKLSFYVNLEDCKLVLRPLSDMTEEEARELCPNGEYPFLKYLSEKDEWYTNRIHFYTAYSECYRFLLSRGFDLFGLIDAGLAIDVTNAIKTKDYDV